MSKKTGINQIALTSFLIGLNSMVLAEDDLSSSEVDFAKEEIAIIDEFFKSEIALNDDSSSKKKQNVSNGKKNQMMVPSLGDKNPPYPNPNRYVFEGSFIYWQADVDGIDYALEVKDHISFPSFSPQGSPTTSIANEKLKQRDLDFKWNPGFKAGIGVIFGDRDEWDLLLRWTWLNSKANRSQNTGPAPNLSVFTGPKNPEYDLSFQVPSFSPNLLGTPATSSHTSWKLRYNTIDLELGRNFFLAKNLTLRSHLGLRGAFLHQRTKVNYHIASVGDFFNPGNNTLMTGSNLGTSIFKGKNNYNAIGIRGGLDTRWNFTDHFCGYGGISAAILYGQFEIDEDFILNTIITPSVNVVPTTIASGLDVRMHRTRTTVQAALGLMWHTGLNSDKQHLAIGAAYEVNEWFQQNELRDIVQSNVSFQSSRSPGDLGLHGVTVDVIFDF